MYLKIVIREGEGDNSTASNNVNQKFLRYIIMVIYFLKNEME